MKQWWMHRGMHEANFTLATVQELKEVPYYTCYTLTCPEALHLASCTSCFTFLLTPSGSLLQAFNL